MRRGRAGGRGWRDWSPGPWPTALALLLICLVAVVPLLRGASPCTHDGGLHYHRVIAMRQALRDGILFTRYLPDLAFGYGYPFFNYREPLSYYLTLGLHLTGMSLPLALNLVYVLSTLGCAAGAFLLARDLFGPTAGLVAAVAYAYAPYQFLDSLLRGNSPESVALAIIPFVLWAFRRLALTGKRSYFVLSAGLLTALYLTHYISSLILAPVLMSYLAALWLVHRRRFHWSATAGALAIAFGLAGAMVIPALFEQQYVQLHMSRVTRNNDFHYNFAGLAEIFAPPRPVDTSLLNPPMTIHLGLVQAILAAVGLVVGLIRSRSLERRVCLAFFGLLAAVLLWMATASSVWTWERLPLIDFVQFPWRFVGRAALPVALLASAAFAAPWSGRPRFGGLTATIASALAVLALVLATCPDTFAPYGYCPSPAYPGITQVFAYEHRTQLVGVDPEGSYFPVWVKRRPEGSALESQYGGASPVVRFDESALPEGARVVQADYGPNRADIVVDTPEPFRATYLLFYFPGWHVKVDGETVDAVPSDPEGLLTFSVPEGQHTVAVGFGETPLRLAADIVSMLSLTCLVLIALRYPKGAGHSQPAVTALGVDHDWPGVSVVVAIAIVAVCSLGLKLLRVDRAETVFRRSGLAPDGMLPTVQSPVDQRYADGLRLIGCDQSGPMVAADEALRVDLYWTTYAQPRSHFQTVVHLVGQDGLRWSKPDSFRPRGYADYPPPRGWHADQYVIDSHLVEPILGTPPGRYDIVLTTFDRQTLAPISALDGTGQAAAPVIVLGQVELLRPDHPAAVEETLKPQLDLKLGSLSLVSAELDRSELAAGDAALLTTFWGTDVKPEGDLEARFVLVSAEGAPAAEYIVPLSAPWWPTSRWQPGDLWRGQHQLRVPVALDSGNYMMEVSVPISGTRYPLPVSVLIEQPRRSYNAPVTEHVAQHALGDFTTLVGYDISATSVQPGETITVTLAWQARGTSTESFHVFVHLIGDEGTLVAQSDGIPSLWSRPTTGWVEGEYVTDTHTFAIPMDALPGKYELRAGMYVPGSDRLKGPNGEDYVALKTVTVSE